MRKLILGIAIALGVACDADRSAVTLTQPSNARASATSIPDAPALCNPCTVGPLEFVRKTGTPLTEAIHFAASAVPFVVDLDNLDSQGASADVSLNGTVVMADGAPSHVHQLVTLAPENTLIVRLTGKPGSRLRVAIWPLEPDPAVLSVSIDPERLMLLPGGQAQLTANVQAVGGAPTTVTWSAVGAAVVSPEGLVTATGNGIWSYDAVITATSTFDPSKSVAMHVEVYNFYFISPAISTDVATGPSTSNLTNVALSATLCRPLDVPYNNPFTSVEFSAMRNGVLVPIGTGAVSSEVVGERIRCWYWSMLWTPGDAFGLGQQTVYATGASLPRIPGSATLRSWPNTAIRTVAP